MKVNSEVYVGGEQRNIRSATLMLVFVTCTYLGSNLLNVIVYTWELIDKYLLLSILRCLEEKDHPMR
ncbi:hypothetical protein NECAME_17862 [Necator americanus]|uniref:G-protein coupled receptors family 1 profile domain-containing protein n=1 Tax=Necator americanus TaxID=51031 RepID=W2TKR7_NECAM|nr:hypothetical protein NECAME_17862 [Necator americanus]ETN81617.1 hypothetical protein NECAME_17862 [Necator americanus]